MKLISFCIPVLNEEDNLEKLFFALESFARSYSKQYHFEFIFTDNNSNDGTWPKVREKIEKDKRYKGIRFSRNIGFQNSILRGYREAKGDAVIQLDADLQDPIEVVGDFLMEWEVGAKVVLGVRKNRPKEPMLSLFRKLGYWAINILSEGKIHRDVGDFRLIDRVVVDKLLRTRNPEPYLRGMVASIGAKTSLVEYSRKERVSGKSKFGLIQIIKLGQVGLFNHSKLPSHLMKLVAISSLVLSSLAAVYYIAARYIQPEWPQGFASVYIFVLLSVSINSFFFLILLGYLDKLYRIAIRDEDYIEEVETG